MFFYHPDHLGSSSYITDANGEVSQHLEYFAFGETFVEEHSNKDATPYLYNAKELDEETGLYYYGARYYDPVSSVWVSVDPLAEKTMTPYQYVNQNPIKLIDPDGLSAESPKPGIGISVGTGGFKANFNISFDQNVGDFTGSYGFGVSYHSNFNTTGKSGFEFRNSFMVGYDDGNTGVSLGSNIWSGTGSLSEFDQRTGIVSFGSGDFSFSYENDGTPFQYAGLGDGGDSYRTAGASVGVGDVSLDRHLRK